MLAQPTVNECACTYRKLSRNGLVGTLDRIFGQVVGHPGAMECSHPGHKRSKVQPRNSQHVLNNYQLKLSKVQHVSSRRGSDPYCTVGHYAPPVRIIHPDNSKHHVAQEPSTVRWTLFCDLLRLEALRQGKNAKQYAYDPQCGGHQSNQCRKAVPGIACFKAHRTLPQKPIFLNLKS
jgi:hypothetical protein